MLKRLKGRFKFQINDQQTWKTLLNYFKSTSSFQVIIVLISTLLQTGCVKHATRQKPAPVYSSSQKVVSEPYNPYASTTPYQFPDKPIETQPLQQSSENASKPALDTGPATYTAPAVLALTKEADNNYKSGHYESAVAAIERALRIEPRNAELIYKLAAVRLKQGKPRLAEDLAKKAELLAAGNVSIKKRSWLLIAEARRLQGDNYGANEAQQKAEQY